jgi:hypothetical protein
VYGGGGGGGYGAGAAPGASPGGASVRGAGYHVLRAEDPPGYELLCLVPGYMLHEVKVGGVGQGAGGPGCPVGLQCAWLLGLRSEGVARLGVAIGCQARGVPCHWWEGPRMRPAAFPPPPLPTGAGALLGRRPRAGAGAAG